MRGFIVICFIYLGPGILSGQSLWYTEYGENQGLMNNGINVLKQDPFGTLWLGTTEGLFKFDGSVFEEIIFNDLNTDKAVYDLAFTEDQVLWIAGKNSLTSYNGLNFLHFSLPDSSLHAVEKPKLATLGNDIFLLAGSGSIYQVRDKKLEVYNKKIPERIIDWIKTGKTLWILTADDNMYILSGSEWDGPYDLPIDKGEIHSFTGGSPVEDGSSLLIADQGILQIKMVDKSESLESGWIYHGADIRTFMMDSRHQFWLVDQYGLLRVAGNDTIRLDLNIPDEGSVYLFEDIEHNIWVNISPGSLYKFPGDEITRLDQEVVQNYLPSSYMYRDNTLWISYFGAGVKKLSLDPGKWSRWEMVTGLISDYVRDMISFDDETWFITARGVTRMKGSNLVHYTVSDGLPHNYCYKATLDQSGRVLVGTERGLAVFENGKFHAVGSVPYISEERVKYVTGLRDGAVLVLKENQVDLFQDDKLKLLIRDGLLKKEILNTAIEDQFGNIWLGSDLNGLIFYQRENGKVRYITRELGFPFSRVRTIQNVNDRELCLGSEKGVFYLEINEKGDITSIQPCGMERGFPDMDVNLNASMKIENRIYFGTNMGTIIFYPDRLKKTQEMPMAHMTGLDLSFRETDWLETGQKMNTWFQIPVKPVLNHEQNDLLFHYETISLQSGDKLWYKYWLENNDNTWSAPTQNTSAIYANLPPGSYNFHVKTSYDGFNWDDRYSSYGLIIAPPFWKTWWFYIIVLSFILVGIILFNNYRIKSKINQLLAIERLKKEEYSRIQKKIAMDFHDEVGNHLTSISLLVELIKSRDWKVEDELKNLLDKIDDESKNLFQGTRDFIWSIDPANDNLEAVYYNIRDYGIDLFDNSSIRFHARNGNIDYGTFKLPAGFTRHIVLIFKEGLNNAMKHAGCKNVYFSIQVSGKDVQIKLKDDGKGFKEQDLRYFEGIKKMKYRGAKIKSDLVLHSDENQGTEIILKAKI